MNNKIIISASPHIHSGKDIGKIMYGVVKAMIPLFLFSIYLFGVSAIIVMFSSVIFCLLFEYLISTFLLKSKASIFDGSALITGMLLAFNIPANLPIWIIAIGALAAIGIGKMSFGGLGNNIFNPALVGRVFLIISFPSQMTSWPIPKGLRTSFFDAQTAATPLTILKEGVRNKESIFDIISQFNFQDLFIGQIGGSMGEMSIILLIFGMIYMLWKKIITWHIPISIIGTTFIFLEVLHYFHPHQYTSAIFHLLSGGLFLGAIFMATDYVTSPMSKKGMIVYGIGIGIITVLIRLYGAYPEGISFAILIMNAFVPIINNYLKPRRFGGKLKA